MCTFSHLLKGVRASRLEGGKWKKVEREEYSV
jgi:hypothetical protein